MPGVRWYIYNPSRKPAHRKHVDILVEALRKAGHEIADFRRADIVYVQTTGPKVPLVMAAARLAGKTVAYYYHEPNTWPEKLRKGDPALYSLVVRLVQMAEFVLAGVVIVSNAAIREKLGRVHPLVARLSRKQVLVAPLMIRDEFADMEAPPPSRPTVLYLGRSDPDYRQFGLFAELSGTLDDVDFTVLTRNRLPRIPGARIRILHEGSFFSEEQRRQALLGADVVWTPYDVPYNQSGIIPDALSAGCGLVVSDHELDAELRARPFVHVLPVGRRPDISALHAFFMDMHRRRAWRKQQARHHFHEKHGLKRQLQVISDIEEIFRR